MEHTGKQKSKLRSIAQTKKPMFQIGKDGMTPVVVQQMLDYLKKHELGKVVVLDTCPNTRDEIETLMQQSDIEIIQVIGKTYVLFRQNLDLKDRIEI